MYSWNKISLIYSNCLFFKNKLNYVHIYVFNNSIIYMMRYSFSFLFIISTATCKIYICGFIHFCIFPYLFKRQGRTRPDKSPAPRMLNYLKVYITTCKTYNYILWQIKNFHLYLVLISIVLLVCDIVCTEHEHYVILVVIWRY